MSILTEAEFSLATCISQLAHCNPFLPQRMELEREVLGGDFTPSDLVWNLRPRFETMRPNIEKIRQRTAGLITAAHDRLLAGQRGSAKEILLYEDLVLYLLYAKTWESLQNLILAADAAKPLPNIADAFRSLAADLDHYFRIPGITWPNSHDPVMLMSIFFQIRRGFHYPFTHVIGTSLAAARLRASIWQSLFTHDLRRYRRALYNRMNDFTTLITGPSGTGKEIVARAIALSRYIPFDERSKGFRENFTKLFRPLNLSALSPTLIESELFGHQRGAFTGALADRRGWLEMCKPLGTVFLDEIGELDPQIQVKLLRVLQERTFQRLGDTSDRHFSGKIIAATNRNLAQEIQRGSFRADFYYRICSDVIITPTLREQLAESPGELRNLILFIATRFAGEEAENITDEVEGWITGNLGRDYAWPGNFRELEQCVRNVLIRQEYRPPTILSDSNDWIDSVLACDLTADELLNTYCRRVYEQTGSYIETARKMRLDRRTIKARIESR